MILLRKYLDLTQLDNQTTDYRNSYNNNNNDYIYRAA